RLEDFQMAWVGRDIADWNLVGSPEAFEVMAVNLPRSGPTLGAAQYDNRPARAESLPSRPRFLLDLANLKHGVLQCGCHRLVHALRVAAFDEVGGITVTDEQCLQFFVTDPGKQGGVVNLVAVEMQNRQHGAVGDRIDKFVAVPTGRKGASLGLAVTHHHESDQVRAVVNCPVRVRYAVSELTALVDASRRFRGGMAADTARKTELFEEALHPGEVLTLVRIYFRVRSLEVRVRQNCWCSVPGTRDEDCVEIVFINQAV